jgi:predicted HicB family RNase H-like nuclease
MASTLSSALLCADEAASDNEPYKAYKGKFALREDEACADSESSDAAASDEEPYKAYKGKFALREDEPSADSESSDVAAADEQPYKAYKGKFALREDEPSTDSKSSDSEASDKKPYKAYKGKYAVRNNEKKVRPSKVTDRTHFVFLEEKVSYFSPLSKKIRNIYAKGMGQYGFELTFPAWRFIYGWTSGSYLSKVGHTSYSDSRTKVQLVPLGIGLKFVYTVKCVDLYAGLGGLGTYFHTRDQSPHVIQSMSKWAAGGIGKLGLFIRPTQGFFIDIFGDYSYMKFDFHGGSKKVVLHNVDFSGWSVGGGIGWTF